MITMEKTVAFFIHKTMSSVLKEEIQIPRHLKRLTMTIDDGRKEIVPIGYLVIKDAKNRIRMQKMLGYGERTLTIGKHSEHTTIGGVSGPIGAGTWTVTLYLLREYMNDITKDSNPIRICISDKKASIKEAVGKEYWIDRHYREPLWLGYYNRKAFYSSKKRWYKGDFHLHTCLSDGRENAESIMKKAKAMDLDFCIPTEHNVLHTGWKDDSLMIIPGIEITSVIGHLNLIGIDKMPERIPEFMENSEDHEEIRRYLFETIREAKKRGWIVSINHPFRKDQNWMYGEAPLAWIDCMEMINHPEDEKARKENEQAVRFLDFLWENGCRIRGIGGSDYHGGKGKKKEEKKGQSMVGDPGTYVYADAQTPDLILEGVKKGHIYVGRGCTAEITIETEEKQILPGDGLEDKDRVITMEIKIKGVPKETQLFLIHNGRKKEVHMESSEKGCRARTEIKFQNGQWNWARLEARTKEGELLLYENPIWQGNREKTFRTYQEALEAFHEN